MNDHSSSLIVGVFLHLCVPGSLWIPDTVSFTMLNVVYFCLPTNLLELCPGMQLTSLETIWSFGVVLLAFLKYGSEVVLNLEFSACKKRSS